MYMYTYYNHIPAKIYLNVVPFKNGGQITYFLLRHFDFGLNLIKKKKKKKKHFSKGIFQWILAHSKTAWMHLHCWNKNWKFLFTGEKHIFSARPKMLIHAN